MAAIFSIALGTKNKDDQNKGWSQVSSRELSFAFLVPTIRSRRSSRNFASRYLPPIGSCEKMSREKIIFRVAKNLAAGIVTTFSADITKFSAIARKIYAHPLRQPTAERSRFLFARVFTSHLVVDHSAETRRDYVLFDLWLQITRI